MRRVIVTGANGFVGSHLCQELLNHQTVIYAVVRHDNQIPDDAKQNPNLKLIYKSLEDLTAHDLPEEEYDAFYHLAWSGVTPNARNNVDEQIANISLSVKMLEVAAALHCRVWIGAGTVAEYEMCKGTIDPAKVASPNSMYGAAKVAVYHMIRVRAKQLNMPFIWTILPSTFGERRMDNSIISYTIQSLVDGKTPMYGTLEQMWDFLYVKDVTRALRLIQEKGIYGKTYGIGSGIHKQLHTWIREIRDVIAPDAELGIGENRSMTAQSYSSCVDTYDLIEDTGFTPEYDFAEGIKRTAEWFMEQKEG